MSQEPCTECGMPCEPGEFHPYAACLMFKACHDNSVVRANLALCRASVPAGWLPIETARAGRTVQLATEAEDGERRTFAASRDNHEGGWRWLVSIDGDVQPLHGRWRPIAWQPLTAPPEAAAPAAAPQQEVPR